MPLLKAAVGHALQLTLLASCMLHAAEQQTISSITLSDAINVNKTVRILWRTPVAQLPVRLEQIVLHLETFKKLPTHRLAEALQKIRAIHHFVGSLYYKKNERHLTYIRQEARYNAVAADYESVVQNWRQAGNGMYHRFYQTYAEILSRLFMQSVCQASLAPQGPAWQACQAYYAEFFAIGPCLENTPSEGRYMHQLQRYRALLNTLEELQAGRVHA